MRHTPLLLLCLAACQEGGGSDGPEFHQTPAGHWYRIEARGRIDVGDYTTVDVVSWLDARIEQWKQQREVQFERAYLDAVALNARFTLIDTLQFPAPDGSGLVMGWAVGNHVTAGIIPYEGWTKVNPYNIKGLIIIPHEMDHLIGIHHEGPHTFPDNWWELETNFR